MSVLRSGNAAEILERLQFDLRRVFLDPLAIKMRWLVYRIQQSEYGATLVVATIVTVIAFRIFSEFTTTKAPVM